MSSVVTLYGMKELPEGAESNMRVDWLDPKQNIGIEIEVEHDGATTTDPESLNLWTVKADGSLRRGQEFVLSRPLRGDALSSAIDEFFQHNTVFKSPTSGTHIHVDMRNKEATLDVAKTMASIIACIEPAIFGMFADGREWCGYTNPISTLPENAAYSLFSDKADTDSFRTVFSPTTREYKYYGFNMLPLGRYGSVEFRYFNTAETAEELIEWVQFCMAVKMAAVGINTRSNLKYFLSSEVCWEEFLSRYFAQWRDRMLPLLPYKDVRKRYKQTRSRPRSGVPQKMRAQKVQQPNNPLADTRFKKFFAVKVRDEVTGRSTLAYDLAAIAAAIQYRVFVRHDPALNTYESSHREGDFLVTDDVLYKYSESMSRWVEVMYYAANPDRVVDNYRTLTRAEADGFVRTALARSNGVQSDDQNDLTRPAYSGWRTKVLRLAGIVDAQATMNWGTVEAPSVPAPSIVEMEEDDSDMAAEITYTTDDSPESDL